MYQPTYSQSYPMWQCPDCDSMFYGGDEKTLHTQDCKRDSSGGYGYLTFIFGPYETWKLICHRRPPDARVIAQAKANPNVVVEYD